MTGRQWSIFVAFSMVIIAGQALVGLDHPRYVVAGISTYVLVSGILIIVCLFMPDRKDGHP